MHIPNNIHRTFAMTTFIVHKAKTIIGVGNAIFILFSITHKEQIFPAISALLRDSQSLFASCGLYSSTANEIAEAR